MSLLVVQRQFHIVLASFLISFQYRPVSVEFSPQITTIKFHGEDHVSSSMASIICLAVSTVDESVIIKQNSKGDLWQQVYMACENVEEFLSWGFDLNLNLKCSNRREEGDADNLDIQDGSEVPPVESTTDLTEEGDVHHTPQAAAGHRLDMTPSALRKRSRSTDIMGAINAMVEHSKARLDLFTTSHTSSASPSPSSINTGGYSITQCLGVLNTIPGLDKATYIKTMNHLTNNAEWRELFMGLDEEKKLWAIKSIP
ncbi:hypothetical protein NE237_023888 [Protea cynaroides]|uniref:Uncharacterized protein n=1 Tax=Protea cynaroides TaxID=273540 RepID=A0A9Q0K4W3_9MAGN|nr:hypothetical protein NE237_023888 [Protea cynaroides]